MLRKGTIQGTDVSKNRKWFVIFMLYLVFCGFKSWPSRTLIPALKEIKTQIISSSVVMQKCLSYSHQSKGLTVLHIRITAAVVCIQLLPHWTVAVNLQSNEKSNLPLNFFKNTHTKKTQPTENNVLCLYKYIYGGWEEGQKTTSALHNISWQANKSWIPMLWPSLFHIHLKARVAVCAPLSIPPPPPPPRPPLPPPHRLYQWEQHQIVPDDTFFE